MDPTANLREQIQIARDIQTTWDHCGEDGNLSLEQMDHVADQANRLAELAEALDGWITKGGFLPDQWRAK